LNAQKLANAEMLCSARSAQRPACRLSRNACEHSRNACEHSRNAYNRLALYWERLARGMLEIGLADCKSSIGVSRTPRLLLVVVFGEAKRPPRRLGRLHPLDERQAGPGGLGMGAGVCGPTRQGGLVGVVFFFFQRGERKITPPHAQPAWTRLALIIGARLPRVSLTPANLAEPGPAWLHTVPYPRTTL
jgi:hypothetical protein